MHEVRPGRERTATTSASDFIPAFMNTPQADPARVLPGFDASGNIDFPALFRCGDILLGLAQSRCQRFAIQAAELQHPVEQVFRYGEDVGAVFTHEIAYVLGQMQNPAAIKALSEAFVNPDLNPMARNFPLFLLLRNFIHSTYLLRSDTKQPRLLEVWQMRRLPNS